MLRLLPVLSRENDIRHGKQMRDEIVAKEMRHVISLDPFGTVRVNSKGLEFQFNTGRKFLIVRDKLYDISIMKKEKVTKFTHIRTEKIMPLWNLDTMRYLNKENVNMRAGGDFILRSSAEKGLLSVVKYLVEQKCIKDSKVLGHSLWGAASCGHVNVVVYLIKQGADIKNCLGSAAEHGHLYVVKILVKRGAYCEHALLGAAKYGHLNIVEYLVKNGFNVQLNNNCALVYAAEYGHLDIVKYLIKQGADIHAGKDHALRRAAEKGHLDVVKYLVKKGANVSANNNMALLWATQPDIIEYLKSNTV